MKILALISGKNLLIPLVIAFFHLLSSLAIAEDIKLTNPFINQRADPSIYRHSDGYYYFTATVPDYDRIVLRRSPTLEGLNTASESVIWRAHSSGPMGAHIWAPEIHFIDNAWYIYFAAGSTENVWAIRMYVLENTAANPFTGQWTEKGKIQTDYESFSLDATTFAHHGSRYLVWAQSNQNNNSSLFIARMENPWTLNSQQVMISRPEFPWETIGYRVNEGPAVIKRHGRIFISYSASATDANYAVGLLSASDTADLLDPSSWHKSDTPIFRSGNGIFGPGHNQFIKSPDGKHDILVFHGRSYETINGDPLQDPNRHTRLQTLHWNEDGSPHFGNPEPEGLVTIGKPLPAPCPISTAPIVHYPFDEQSGTEANDIASCHAQQALLFNGATWSDGREENAVWLDGKDDYVKLPNNIAINLQDFTISAWVNLKTLQPWSRIFDIGSSRDINMFLTPVNGKNGNLLFAISDGNSYTELFGNSPLPINSWTHVAVSKAGHMGTLYVNGQNVGSIETMTQSPKDMNNTAKNYLGRSQWPADPYLEGLIDDFRIFNRALRVDEISNLASIKRSWK